MKNDYENDYDANEEMDSSAGDFYDNLKINGSLLHGTDDRLWKQNEINRLKKEYREYREKLYREDQKETSDNDVTYGVAKPQSFGGEAEKTLAGKSARNLKKRGLGSRIAGFIKNLTKNGKPKEKQDNGMQK